MNKDEIKKILKPLIKETIKEMLFEEGFLSLLIKECISGVSGDIVLKKEEEQGNKRFSEFLKKDSVIKKEKITENLKKKIGIDVFQGTKPMTERPAADPFENSYTHFTGIDPEDPGVDLSLFGFKK